MLATDLEQHHLVVSFFGQNRDCYRCHDLFKGVRVHADILISSFRPITILLSISSVAKSQALPPLTSPTASRRSPGHARCVGRNSCRSSITVTILSRAVSRHFTLLASVSKPSEPRTRVCGAAYQSWCSSRWDAPSLSSSSLTAGCGGPRCPPETSQE
jgi:hypothetical protein